MGEEKRVLEDAIWNEKGAPWQEEGFEGAGPAELAAGWARHLMAAMAEWQARGPRRVRDGRTPRTRADPPRPR